MLNFVRFKFRHSSLLYFFKINNNHYRNVTRIPKDVNTKNIRNIGIIAHIDAGKTTTTERMLYYSGFTNMMGEVHDGDTIMDYMPQERERGITITSAAITFNWKKHKINLIDTPGHVDFTIEVERSLCALDGGIVILDSSAGVEVQTITVWSQANRYGIPCIVYLNKMDKPTADFGMSLNSLQQKLKIKPLVLHIPLGNGKSFNGVIDVVSREKITWDITGTNKDGHIFKSENVSKGDSYSRLVEEKREELIEAVADLDDNFANKLILEGPESLSNEDLYSAIRNITLKKAAVPVLCGSSYKNIGVQLLMDAVLLYLPNPLERTHRFSLSNNDDELCALVFKIIHNKKQCPLTFLRLYSGVIKSGQKIYNVNRKKTEKIMNLMIPFADEFCEVDSVLSGNIVVATGLNEAITGDMFVTGQSNKTSVTDIMAGDREVNVKTDSLIQIPDPVFFCTIEPPSLRAQNQLEMALRCLEREDPTFRVEHDDEIGQIIISGMGELHIQVMKERILQEYGIDSYLGPLQVAYRESVSSEKSDMHILDKTLGGTRHFVKIMLAIRPDPNCGKFKEVKVIVTKENELGKVRADYLKSINSGITSALNHGPILGFPVIDVKVSLLWLEITRGTSGPMISAAASQCIQHILKNSQVLLLEPIMKLSITSSCGYVGCILGDLTQKRSQIFDMQVLSDVEVIHCRTPLSELRGYSTTLRAITSGKCTFTMEFDSYERMDSQEQAKAVKEITGFSPL